MTPYGDAVVDMSDWHVLDTRTSVWQTVGNGPNDPMVTDGMRGGVNAFVMAPLCRTLGVSATGPTDRSGEQAGACAKHAGIFEGKDAVAGGLSDCSDLGECGGPGDVECVSRGNDRNGDGGDGGDGGGCGGVGGRTSTDLGRDPAKSKAPPAGNLGFSEVSRLPRARMFLSGGMNSAPGSQMPDFLPELVELFPRAVWDGGWQDE